MYPAVDKRMDILSKDLPLAEKSENVRTNAVKHSDIAEYIYSLKEKITAELQLHSDQGFQYTSHGYYRIIKSNAFNVKKGKSL